MNGSWRDMGVPGLWYAMGELSFATDSTSNSPWIPRQYLYGSFPFEIFGSSYVHNFLMFDNADHLEQKSRRWKKSLLGRDILESVLELRFEVTKMITRI